MLRLREVTVVATPPRLATTEAGRRTRPIDVNLPASALDPWTMSYASANR